MSIAYICQRCGSKTIDIGGARCESVFCKDNRKRVYGELRLKRRLEKAMKRGEWQGSRMKCPACGEYKEVRYLLMQMEVRCPKCGAQSEIKWIKEKKK